jgi:uncharacterized protein (TIGR03000 family)
MYSVMLMMAMTSGGDLPNLGHHGCCGGYSSCCGGYGGGYSCCGGYSSCCGGGYGGYSCCGGYESCCGGGHHGLFGGHRHSCCGGYSSCCGGYGGYSSCCGGYGGYSCCGGYGGYSCCGGYIMGGYPGGVIGGPGMGTPPVTNPMGGEKIGNPKGDNKESMVPAPATIIVSLPADAKLTIDDAATVSTSTTRVFTSPELPPGKDFHYTLKAEYSRDGKPVVLSKEITVRAGAATQVDMQESAGIASR